MFSLRVRTTREPKSGTNTTSSTWTQWGLLFNGGQANEDAAQSSSAICRWSQNKRYQKAQNRNTLHGLMSMGIDIHMT